MKRLGFGAALLCTASLGFAGTVNFSGGGSSGTVTPNETWTATVQNDGTDDIWGIPGFNNGAETWNGGAGMDAMSFTLTGTSFSNTGFDQSMTPSCAGTGLVMCDILTMTPWTTLVNGNTVTFTAPAGDVVKPGELFFVEIPIGIQVTTDFTPAGQPSIQFTGTWTIVPAGVPEPGSFLLLGGGLAGLGWIARKRSKN